MGINTTITPLTPLEKELAAAYKEKCDHVRLAMDVIHDQEQQARKSLDLIKQYGALNDTLMAQYEKSTKVYKLMRAQLYVLQSLAALLAGGTLLHMILSHW